jgi:monothiol glutaredoxin
VKIEIAILILMRPDPRVQPLKWQMGRCHKEFIGIPCTISYGVTSRSAAMTNPVFQQIEQTIKDHPVVLFMKGTVEFPMCGFSARVASILEELNVPYKDVDIMSVEGLRQGIKDYTNWPTVPQLYIQGEFIGGCDIVSEMYESGELQAMLVDKAVLKQAS